MVLNAATCSDGDYSRYVSKELAATSGSCLSFSYRKPSANTGPLAVILYNDWDGENEIWSKKDGTGGKHLLAKVDIKSSHKFTVSCGAIQRKEDFRGEGGRTRSYLVWRCAAQPLKP